VKKSFQFIWLFGIVVLMCSCQNNRKEAENVARKYLNHMNRMEYDEAKKFGTNSTIMLLEQIQSFMDLSDTMGNRLIDKKITINSCQINSDTALCKFEVDGNIHELKLVFINERWWVHFGDGLPKLE